MAWYEGFSSLKGQLSNLAKGVLTDDTDEDKPTTSNLSSGPPGNDERVVSNGNVWTDLLPSENANQGAIYPAGSSESAASSSTSRSKGDDDDGSVLSKGLASLLSLGGKIPDIDIQLKQLQEENRALREENESKTREIRNHARVIANLETLVAASQDENSNLSTGMEELDFQHQQAIDQAFSVKEETQKRYQQLQERHAELATEYEILVETCKIQSEKLKSTERPADKASGDENLSEPSKTDASCQVDELVVELEARDQEVQYLENEVSRLNEINEEISALLSNKSLPTIPENSEDLENLNARLSVLEKENMALLEVRTNLETEVTHSREQNEDMTRRLQAARGAIKNQENLQIDYENLTAIHAQKEQELVHTRAYVEKLENDLKKAIEEGDEFRARMSETEVGGEARVSMIHEENIKLNKRMIALRQQLQKLDEELEKCQRDNETKDKKLCELMFELNSAKTCQTVGSDELNARIVHLENELKNRDESVNKLKEELEGLIQARENQTKNEQELNEALSRIDALTEELKDVKSEYEDQTKAFSHKVETLTGSLSELEIAKDLAREKEAELKRQLDEKDDELWRTSERMSNAEEELELARSRIAQVDLDRNENEELRRSLQMKHTECLGYSNEVQRLNNALSSELDKTEKLTADSNRMNSDYIQLQTQLQDKMSYVEQMETDKNKQITSLKQEVESLRNQLEYVSQLLKSVERGEGEGQGETPPHQKTCLNGCVETQEELSRVTTALLKEQTEVKLLRSQVDDLNERLVKDNAQLTRLKDHLVTIEENYPAEIVSLQNQLQEATKKLQQADERARTSSTAYTSANIRANQQVESLSQQVKLLTEHKEKLERELSNSEDNQQKQSAAITNLQAALQQFLREKQSEVDFETERIRQKLNASNAKNHELSSEIVNLQDQLGESKKSLVTVDRLTDQLNQKLEVIEALQNQVKDLQEKFKAEEDKIKAASSNNECKVDRGLVKNILVNYLCSPPNSKEQVLRVIAQVLELSKEERVKVGLEPDTTAQHKSLSEAFIRFLESESQPKPQVFLPLSQSNSTPSSRKTSTASSASLLITEELPNMPHFAVGRSTGSILQDVLKDRNT